MKNLNRCEVLPPLDGERPRVRSTTPKRESQGRFQVLNNFVDFSLRELTRNELAVWLILYRHTRDGIARYAQTAIAKQAGISDRTVRRIVPKLEEHGLLKVAHRGSAFTGPSVYQIFPLIKENQ